MTEYFIQQTHKSNFVSTAGRHKSLKDAKEQFNKLCENNPKENFKIVRRIVIDEVVCESEDYRQTRFAF